MLIRVGSWFRDKNRSNKYNKFNLVYFIVNSKHYNYKITVRKYLIASLISIIKTIIKENSKSIYLLFYFICDYINFGLW